LSTPPTHTLLSQTLYFTLVALMAKVSSFRLSTRCLCIVLLAIVACNVALHGLWALYQRRRHLPKESQHTSHSSTQTEHPGSGIRPGLVSTNLPHTPLQQTPPPQPSLQPPQAPPPEPALPHPTNTLQSRYSQVFTDMLQRDPNKHHIMHGTFPKPARSPPADPKPVARRAENQPSFEARSPISTLHHLPHDIPVLDHQFKLVVGINTIVRLKKGSDHQHEDYLLQTLRSLKQQLSNMPAEQRDCILVFVSNFDNKPHTTFESAKLEFQNLHQDAYHFYFYTAANLRLSDPFADIPGNDYLAPENSLPGHLARQQNADVLTLLSTVFRTIPNFEYFLFMEDDFLACDNSLSTILNDLRKIEAHTPARKALCGLRLSYGMSGLILDRIRAWYFAYYLSNNLDLFPVDLLIRKYMFEHKNNAGRDVPHTFGFCKPRTMSLFVHKHVLLEHIGETSTFLERNEKGFRPPFPGCGESMARVWNLDGKERFNTLCDKAGFDISPCHWWR